jgi:hypothetical protein
MDLDDPILVSVDDHFLDRIERTCDMHHNWTGQDLGDLTPTEQFLRNVLLCFISDPFEHISREDATVAALQRQAEGHDITVRSMGRGRVETDGLNIGELSKTATGR